MVFAFPPPAVIELGNAKGFDFQLLDRGGLGHEALMAARNQLLGMAAKDPRLTAVRPNSMEDVPEYRVDVDWEKAGALGVPISSIHTTISAAFGSAYVNDFIQGGRVKRVYVQADAPYRMLPKDLEKLYVRNTAGKMVPFSSFASGHWTSGSPQLERYNGFPSMNIWGEPAPGRSSGEAMQAMEEIVAKLPKGIGFDWTGLSYQERMSSSQAPLLYAFSIFVIFLCLAALYESWPIPISILLVLPLGVIGGVIASSLRGLANDVYFQIGLLTTLGLTTKNAILIVQFAKAGLERGHGADRGHPGGGETAVPADPHDLAGLRLRRPAPGPDHRRRGRRPERHRHRRPGRHGDRHGPGGHLCAALLRADRKDLRQTQGRRSSQDRRMQIHRRSDDMKRNMLISSDWHRRPSRAAARWPRIHAARAPVPADWPTGAAYEETKSAASAPAAADLPWREFFTDDACRRSSRRP